MADLTSLDDGAGGRSISLGAALETTPARQSQSDRRHTVGSGSLQDISGVSVLSLMETPGAAMPSPSLFSPASLGGSDGGGGSSQWERQGSPTGVSRHRVVPSSYSRQVSPRSRTTRARQRARAGGEQSPPLAGGDSRILDNLAAERSGIFSDGAATASPSRYPSSYRNADASPGGFSSGRSASQKERAAALAQRMAAASPASRSPGRQRARTPPPGGNGCAY